MNFRDLAPGVVHVWRLVHDRGTPLPAQAIGALSPDEVIRAERQRDPARRLGFELTRTALRLLLGRYLDRDPASLRLIAAEGEKPAVDGPLRYSTSTTTGLSLIAVAIDVEVGIDVEARSIALDVDELAPVVLSPAELATFDGTAAALLDCWVWKEAVLKAAGVGLRVPPSSFSSPAEVEPGDWAVQRIDVGPDLTAALAAPRPFPAVERFDADLSSLA